MLSGVDWFNLIAGVAAALLGWRALSAKTNSAVPGALGSFLIWLGSLYVWQAGKDAFVGRVDLSVLILAASLGVALSGFWLTAALWRLDRVPRRVAGIVVAYVGALMGWQLVAFLAEGEVEAVAQLELPTTWLSVQLIAKGLADIVAAILIATLCAQSYVASSNNKIRFEGLGLFTVGFLTLVTGSAIRIVVPASGSWDTFSIAHAVTSAAYQLTILVWIFIAVRRKQTFAWKIATALIAIVSLAYFAHFVAGGVWVYPTLRILGISLLAIATLRGHLEGMDAQLRFGISKSAVAAVFVAVFFIASEGTQTLVGERFQSEYIGIAAAGLLVLGISPLMRWADQVAMAAVPIGRGGDPAEIYLEAYRTAMADGTVSSSEELHLADLAERLGLGHRRAAEIRVSSGTE